MAEVILMPRLSDTMTEGVIAAWHKKVGDPVKKGDLLAEVETDKATMELESYKDGTLLHIGADKGGKLQVNDLLAIIGKPGEDITGLVKGGGEAAAEPSKKRSARKRRKSCPRSRTSTRRRRTATRPGPAGPFHHGRSDTDAPPQRYNDRRRDSRMAQERRRCREKRRCAGRHRDRQGHHGAGKL